MMAPSKEKRYVSDNAQLLAEWDWEKNGDLSPYEVTCGSGRKVWWHCSTGHTYQMTIENKSKRGFGCPICSGHRTMPGVNDFATNYPDIAKEWHPTKNGNLLPSEISRKNGRKVWWLGKCGHEWQATPKDRADSNTGCPFCSAKRQTSYPEQAILYYVKKLYPDVQSRCKCVLNNGMELDIYIPSIQTAIEYDGAKWHDVEAVYQREIKKYEMCREKGIKLIRVREQCHDERTDIADIIYTIHNRRNKRELTVILQEILNDLDRNSNSWTRKNPHCFQSRITVNLNRDNNEILEYLTEIPNSIVELRPDLAEEWHPTKNGKLRATMFGINSNEFAWWKCKTCGYEWKTIIISRGGKKNSGCPACSKRLRGITFTENVIAERGSLAQRNPQLAKEWHPTKNGTLKPDALAEKNNKKVWWKCARCGYDWEATPNNRSKGVGCPACSGRVPREGENDLKTLYPEIAKDWNYKKNGVRKPEHFLPKSGKRVWWLCQNCGYEWENVIRSRTNGAGCPQCSRKR